MACKNNSGKTGIKEMAIEQGAVVNTDFSGNYVSDKNEKRHEGCDWIAVLVKQIFSDDISISMRSRADRKKTTCTFDDILGNNI